MRIIVYLAIFPAIGFLLGRTSRAEVIAWGDISNQVTGLRSGYSSNGLVLISGEVLRDATSVSSGFGHNLGLRNDGVVVGWGWNKFGQVNNAPSEERNGTNGAVLFGGQVLAHIKAVAAGSHHSLALKEDGTVLAWGGDHRIGTEVPMGLSDVVSVAAGWYSSLALKEDGTVESWGKCYSPPNGLSNVVAISAGPGPFSHHLALKSDGTVVEWPPGAAIARLSNVVAISAGHDHRLALKDDGTVFGWGSNSRGQATGVPTAKATHFSAGLVSLDGEVLRDVRAVAAGDGCSLALKNNGTLVLWGDDHRGQLAIPDGLSNIVAISAGWNICLAVTTNRAVAERFRH